MKKLLSFDNDINSMYAGVFYAPYIPRMTLIVGEARWHGAKYHTVEPVFGDWKQLEAWAIETYGAPANAWDLTGPCGRWYMNDRKFWFRDIKDLEWFMLRWS